MKKQSFTLIEILIGFFLIFMGMTAVVSLIIQLIGSFTFYSHKLIASYLTQEGIEIIRNFRDTNLLQEKNWDEGLVGEWEADYNDQNLSPYTGKFLNIESSSGLYGYDSGSPTIFQRKISVQKPNPNILNVKVQVFWREKGKVHQVEAQENLYNFR